MIMDLKRVQNWTHTFENHQFIKATGLHEITRALDKCAEHKGEIQLF